MNTAWLRYLPAFARRRLEGRHDLQKVIGNTGWLFADKILRMGVGLLVGVWVARYLGPERFGLLSFAGAFVALFSAVATLGLDGIVVRDIVREPERKDEIIGTAFVLKFAGGIAAFLLTMVAVVLFRHDEWLTYWLVGIIAAGTMFQSFDIIELWFQANVQSKYPVYAKNAAFFILTIVKIILILCKAPLVAFACAGLGEIAVASLGLVVVYRAVGFKLNEWRVNLSTGKKLLNDSWPLILSGVVTMIYLRIDQVMIGQMVGDKEVGIYSAAVRIAEAWYFVPMAVSASVFPSIIEAKSLGDDCFYKRLQKFYNLMALLGYVVAVPVTFFGGWLIKVLFGSAYEKAGPMLALLIWAGLFVNLGVARSSFLTTMNWTRVHFVTVFLGCIVNVMLNIVLIPRFGGMGAVIASVIAYWLAAHGSCFVYKPMFNTGRMLTKALIYPRIW